MRPLSYEERFLIARFAEKLSGARREQLLSDASHATAEAIATDGSRIIFNLADYHRPPYRGQHSFGVEGRMLDTDEAELSVCLYADENGRLLELEFIRWDSTTLLGPRRDTLKVF